MLNPILSPGFEPWPRLFSVFESPCCVLGQDNLFSRCSVDVFRVPIAGDRELLRLIFDTSRASVDALK